MISQRREHIPLVRVAVDRIFADCILLKVVMLLIG
jgi:hypothetical protein